MDLRYTKAYEYCSISSVDVLQTPAHHFPLLILCSQAAECVMTKRYSPPLAVFPIPCECLNAALNANSPPSLASPRRHSFLRSFSPSPGGRGECIDSLGGRSQRGRCHQASTAVEHAEATCRSRMFTDGGCTCRLLPAWGNSAAQSICEGP